MELRLFFFTWTIYTYIVIIKTEALTSWNSDNFINIFFNVSMYKWELSKIKSIVYKQEFLKSFDNNQGYLSYLTYQWQIRIHKRKLEKILCLHWAEDFSFSFKVWWSLAAEVGSFCKDFSFASSASKLAIRSKRKKIICFSLMII